MPPTPNRGTDELIQQLELSRTLHRQRAATPPLAAALDQLADWQARRLSTTYADLARDSRYTQAIAFFRSDLYGPGDFSRRDADLARVVPVMVRVLPASVVATVTMAMELSVLSQQLDRALVARLDGMSPLGVPAYCDAYRACANRQARERQIELVVSIGRSIDRYVRKPLIRSAVAMMRSPARRAGLAALQDFLERGFASFAQMRGATEFLSAIHVRETALMQAIFSGDRAPFPDPLD